MRKYSWIFLTFISGVLFSGMGFLLILIHSKCTCGDRTPPTADDIAMFLKICIGVLAAWTVAVVVNFIKEHYD
jgi:hypothetical protein